MLSNMKIGQKLFSGFFFMIFLLLVAAGTGWYGIAQLGKTLVDVKRASDVSNMAGDIETAAKAAEADMLRYARTVAEETYKSIQANSQQMIDQAAAITNTTDRDVMRDYAKQVKPFVDSFITDIGKVHDSVFQRRNADEERRKTGLELTCAITALRDHLSEFRKLNSEREKETIARRTTSQRYSAHFFPAAPDDAKVRQLANFRQHLLWQRTMVINKIKGIINKHETKA